MVPDSLLPIDCSPPGSSTVLRQEHWSGVAIHSPGDLPNPGIDSQFPTQCLALQADYLPLKPPEKPISKAAYIRKHIYIRKYLHDITLKKNLHLFTIFIIQHRIKCKFLNFCMYIIRIKLYTNMF